MNGFDSPRRALSGGLGGMQASQVKRLKEPEDENRQLERMRAELSLDHRILREIVRSMKRFRRWPRAIPDGDFG